MQSVGRHFQFPTLISFPRVLGVIRSCVVRTATNKHVIQRREGQAAHAPSCCNSAMLVNQKLTITPCFFRLVIYRSQTSLRPPQQSTSLRARGHSLNCDFKLSSINQRSRNFRNKDTEKVTRCSSIFQVSFRSAKLAAFSFRSPSFPQYREQLEIKHSGCQIHKIQPWQQKFVSVSTTCIEAYFA